MAESAAFSNTATALQVNARVLNKPLDGGAGKRCDTPNAILSLLNSVAKLWAMILQRPIFKCTEKKKNTEPLTSK